MNKHGNPRRKRVVVIGAGIVGTTTAVHLAKAGHQVDVFEASPGEAGGASYANAGLISPGHCFSWAERETILGFLKSMLGRGDGPSITQPWSIRLWRWAWQFYKHSSPRQWAADSRAALALSSYSRNVHFGHHEIDGATYGAARRGILYLYQRNQAPRSIEKTMLEEFGEPYALVDGVALSSVEPLLAHAGQAFDHGVYCPHDATGNARSYASAACKLAKELGVLFHFNAPVRRLIAKGDEIAAIEIAGEAIKADYFVIAAGLASADLLRPIGYSLPVYPAAGYSITYRHAEDILPTVGVVSLADKIAWAGFEPGVIRFTGFVDIGPKGSEPLVARRYEALEKFATEIFPCLKKYVPERWSGLRPMTPDGIPILGRSRHPNMLFNFGHGAMGWTMASGSAHIINDLVAGMPAAIDCEPYRWNRFL